MKSIQSKLTILILIILTAALGGLSTQLSSLNTSSFLVGVGILLVSGICVVALTRKIVKPIITLKHEIITLAEKGGDLTQEINVSSKDEVGELTHAFNKFLANLRTIMTEINESATNVAEHPNN